MTLDNAKIAGDVVSATVMLATLAKLLPVIAAALTIVWTVIRIYETRTVQGWLGHDVPSSKHDG